VLESTGQIAYLTQTSNHVITLNNYRHHYSPPTSASSTPKDNFENAHVCYCSW